MKGKKEDIGLSQKDLKVIGDMLGFIPSAAAFRARRFVLGLKGQLKNWNYDETINYGEMGIVLKVINYINQINPNILK